MSCYTTSASSGSIALARALTGVAEKEIGRQFHALKASARGQAQSAPTSEEWLEFLTRQRNLLASTTLTGPVKFSIERRLDAAFTAATDGTQGPPDGATFYALSNLSAEATRQADLARQPPALVALPELMPPAQRASWEAILQVAQVQPEGWTIVGGQMVALHCWERGAAPARPTNDGDAVLDVRARPSILRDYTAALTGLGFRSAGGSSLNTHEHRWIREADGAQLDVLIPDGTGVRAAGREGVTGGTTVATPGGADALAHSRPVRARLGEVEATVYRPHLVGALIAKARAAGNPFDPRPARHLLDAAILISLLSRDDRPDLTALTAQTKHRTTLATLLGSMERQPVAWASQRSEALAGLKTLQQAVSRAERGQ
jgi:hypothetical protein